MQTSHSRSLIINRARNYYWLWGHLPYDYAAQLVNAGYIVSELETAWDKEFAGDIFHD
jgi:hypothetical protein